MSDKELVQELLERNPVVTRLFFYEKCRPLFLMMIKKFYDFPIDYDEFVNEVMIFLFEKDAFRLRQFRFESSLYTWLKTCLIRHFIRNRNVIIDASADEQVDVAESIDDKSDALEAKVDVEILLNSLFRVNKRYSYILRRLMLEDASYEEVAEELHVTAANLYNLKKRAITELTKIALGTLKK